MWFIALQEPRRARRSFFSIKKIMEETISLGSSMRKVLEAAEAD
jgi:hypothetical protein